MTSLPIPRWMLATARAEVQKRTAQVTQTSKKELATMNLMMIVIVLAVAGAATEVIASPDQLSTVSQILMGLIAGSGGLIVNIATFRPDEELCPRKIARQTLAALPTSAFVGPSVAWIVAKTFQTESNMILLSSTAFGMGLAGPYLLAQYGKQAMELVGKMGILRIKKELGDVGE